MARPEKTEPLPVCVDADVLIAGLLSRTGASHAILVLGEIGLLRLVLSEAAVAEVRRNLVAKLPRLPRSSRNSFARFPSRSIRRRRTTVNVRRSSLIRRTSQSSPRRLAPERVSSSRTTSGTFALVRECASSDRERSSRKPAPGWRRSERETKVGRQVRREPWRAHPSGPYADQSGSKVGGKAGSNNAHHRRRPPPPGVRHCCVFCPMVSDASLPEVTLNHIAAKII